MLREIANAAQKFFRRTRAYVFGERSLLAFNVWQLAKRICVPFTDHGMSMFTASCRETGWPPVLRGKKGYRIASANRDCVGFSWPPFDGSSAGTCAGAVSFMPTSLLMPRSCIVTP